MCGAAHILLPRTATYASARRAGRMAVVRGGARRQANPPADWKQEGDGMLRVIAGLMLLALGTGGVLAENTAVIKQRQDLMKANAEALKEPEAMARGKAPFDLAKVKA